MKSTDPDGRAPASRRTRRASIAAAVPPFMSAARWPVDPSPSTGRAGKGEMQPYQGAQLKLDGLARPPCVEPDDDGGGAGVPTGRAGRRVSPPF